MTSFPLIHILFWIALVCAPHGTTKITITPQDAKQAWTWTFTPKVNAWTNSNDQSLWAAKGNIVVKKTGDKPVPLDVGNWVKGVSGHDWSTTPTIKLEPMTTLTKTGDSFTYTLNAGDKSEQKFVIGYK